LKRIGLVSCAPLPEPDPDESLLLDALQHAGMSPVLVPWNDPVSRVDAFDLCILRSCWDYHLTPDRFLEWLEFAAARTILMNPLSIVKWNIHKGYLRDLEAAGVPAVPTAWISGDDPPGLADLMTGRGWDDVVVKPAIGAGSYQTRRFGVDQARAQGDAFVASLTERGDAMVQPFMSSVTTAGERSLVWIDGEFTHQVIKQPRYHGQDEQVSAASVPAPGDLRIAEKAIACVGGPLLYARVDLIEDDDGLATVSELELIEPSLFLLQHRPALDRFVAAVGRYA